MPSKFPWTKSAPAQVVERLPVAEPQTPASLACLNPEAYYAPNSLREAQHSVSQQSSSQPSSRSNSAFGVHSGRELAPLGGQPYDQQHTVSTPGSASSGQQGHLHKKSIKTRLGIGGASSSREELQETLKEVPAPKGIFGRKKSVVKRKEAPSTATQNPPNTGTPEIRDTWKGEIKTQPPPSKEVQGFEPYDPNFTREQLDRHQYTGSEPSVKQHIEAYRGADNPIAISLPQSTYQIYHPPAVRGTQALVQTPLASSRRPSNEGSVLSSRQSQGGSRPSSRQSYGQQVPSQQQARGYEHRVSLQQGPRREDSEAMGPPIGARQHRQSQTFDSSKLSSSGQISRENSTMHPSPLRPGDTNPAYLPQGSLDESVNRRSPPLPRSAREMSDADINKLLKDYADLRAKYNNVKRQYFEKKDQVEGLQDSLAQQRLSQSRTCLDDGEYIARMTRLDGLVSQLAFIVRKDWKSIPDWLQPSVNEDAMQVGKQEMTAVGRAVISRWLADEIFDKYFHPGLEPELSTQLKVIQRSIWMSGLPCNTAEDEESLVSKIIAWRLTTAEGLKGTLASSDALSQRQVLVHILSQQLLEEMRRYLDEQAAGGVEGGITMIVELAVGILANLPLESRDVCIQYFPPGYPILPDLMKLESGIPLLSSGETEGKLSSEQSNDSPSTENHEGDAPSAKSHETVPTKGFFGKGGSGSGRRGSANTSQKMVGNPQTASSPTVREEPRPTVRLCAFLALQIRGKMVLVKAPVFKV